MKIEEIKNGLRSIFDGKKIIDLENQRYIVNPLTDHEPYTSFDMLDSAIATYQNLTDLSKATKLIGEEDRGGFLCALMAYKTKIPFGLIKWNPNGYEGQHAVEFRNAYAEGKLYLNGAQKGDKVVIIEDIIDTGGTIIALIHLLKKAEIEIVDVIALAAKKENNGIERIYNETGIKSKVGCFFSLESELSKVVSFGF